jgi:hypothetical protein
MNTKKIWTVRLDGAPQPFLWVLDEGLASEDTVYRVVKTCVDAGETVIVGLVRHSPRRERES